MTFPPGFEFFKVRHYAPAMAIREPLATHDGQGSTTE